MTIVQRRLLSLAILLPSAAIAWSFGIFWQQQREAARAKDAAAKKVWACQTPVLAVSLTRQGNTIELARRKDRTAPLAKEEAWRLEAPMAAAGDADTIEALVEAACSLETLGRIVAKPGEPALSLTSFGLSPPSSSLTLTFADGASKRVAFGDKSSFDGSLFVAPEPAAEAAADANAASAPALAIDRVDGGFGFQLERDAFSLRDKKLLAWRAQDVNEVVVRVGRSAPTGNAALEPSFSLRRQGGSFDLIDLAKGNSPQRSPEPLRADVQQARTFLEQLTSLRATRYVDADLSHSAAARFGLDEPAVEFALTNNGGQATTLRLGKLALGEATHLFAQSAEPNAPIAEVKAESLLEIAEGKADKLRDLHLLHVGSDEVASLVIEAEGDKLHLVRTAASNASGPATWRVASADAAAAEALAVDSARVSGLVFRLCNLRADTLGTGQPTAAELAAAKLAPPQFLVRLADPNAQVLGTLRVGPPAAERRPAQGDDGPIGSIFAGAIDGLSAKANDFAPAKSDGKEGSPTAP